MKPITTVFLIFLLLTFISGIYFCATHDINTIRLKEGFDPATDLQGPTTIDCPNLLIKSGNYLLLFNSKLPQIPGTNPLPFYSLDEYINYLENQRKKGIRCPVLFVQEENNTQGQSVFRIRPDVFQPQGGLPITNQQVQDTQNQFNNFQQQQQVQQVEITDASRDHGPWNANQYSGFDPIGQHIGQYTTLDALHDSTFKGQSLSENPMDANWGGVLYTKQSVDSGKYKDNEVVPPSASGIFAQNSDNIHDQKINSSTNIFA
jgi:hypothetical protein